MSSLSTTGAVGLLRLLFRNEAFALVGDEAGLVGSTVAGNLYVGLHTALPTGGEQASNEFADAGYARLAIARTSGAWTLDDTPDVESKIWVVNAADLVFGEVEGPGGTITHASIGTAFTGAGLALLVAELDPPIEIETNDLPKIAAGQLRVAVSVADS